jgi:ABC-type transporter Mla MlaB component
LRRSESLEQCQRNKRRRERQVDDGRGTRHADEAGIAALADYRSKARAVLGAYLSEIPDEQVRALAAATDALAGIIALLDNRSVR